MKKVFLMLISLVVLGSCKSNNNLQSVPEDTIMTAPALEDGQLPTDPTQSDAAKSVVPSEYVDVINGSTAVKWYLVDARTEETHASTSIDDCGDILSSAVEDKDARRDAIVETLVYPGSFAVHQLMKDCTFMADVAIEFTAGNESVLVMYSFYCDVCRFAKQGKYVDFDGELVRESVLQIAAEVFPNDKYLRRLKR